MFNPKVECISTKQKYNIQFLIPFIICVCIMLSEKIYLMFNNVPELFDGVDIIYHSIANILSVIAQLAASVAAAIIFYYCVEFLNKKKDMEKYIVFRRILLIQIYSFMKIFEHFNGFEDINRAKNNKRMHDLYDVERFYYILRKTEDYSFRQSLINEIKEYIQKNMSDFHGVIRSLRSTVDELSGSVLSYRYFRNSFNKVNDIKNIFEELDGIFIIFKDEIGSGQIDEEDVLNQIAEYFIDFVCEFVDFEVVLGTFVAALNKKNMFTFMRLLD